MPPAAGQTLGGDRRSSIAHSIHRRCVMDCHQAIVVHVGALEWKVPVKSEMLPVACSQLVGKHEMTNTNCCELKAEQRQLRLVWFLAHFWKPHIKGPLRSPLDCCVQRHPRPVSPLHHHVARTDTIVCQDLAHLIFVNAHIKFQYGCARVYTAACHLKMERITTSQQQAWAKMLRTNNNMNEEC